MLTAIVLCVGWILVICIHEFGHAVIAYYGGDTSVKEKGYLSFNPLNYAHPIHSLLIPVIFLLFGAIPLPGAAVYIEKHRLRSRFWVSAVAAAGPIANLLLAVILSIPFHAVPLRSVFTDASLLLKGQLPFGSFWIGLACLITLTIHVAIINLLPIPPLDGYGIIQPWLPKNIQNKLQQFSSVGIFILFGILKFVPFLGGFLLIISGLIAQLLGVPLSLVLMGYRYIAWEYISLTFALLLILVTVYWLFKARHNHNSIYRIFHVLGNLFIHYKQYSKALVCFDKLVKHQPNYYEGWFNQGNVFMYLERYEEAIACYDQANELRPEYHLAWYNKGITLSKMGENQLALNAFEQTIQSQPDYYQAWYNKGVTLSKLNKIDESLFAYNEVIKINRDFAPAWMNRGVLLTDLEKYQEAAFSFEQAHKYRSGYYEVFHNQGIMLSKQKHYTEAIYAFDQAMKIKSDYI